MTYETRNITIHVIHEKLSSDSRYPDGGEKKSEDDMNLFVLNCYIIMLSRN